MNEELKPAKPIITNSLIKRFRKSIIWLYIATVATSVPIIYFATRYVRAWKQIETILTGGFSFIITRIYCQRCSPRSAASEFV